MTTELICHAPAIWPRQDSHLKMRAVLTDIQLVTPSMVTICMVSRQVRVHVVPLLSVSWHGCCCTSSSPRASHGPLTHTRPAGEMHPPVTVVLINNAGGGIFSMLPGTEAIPQAAFTQLWATPPNVDLSCASQMHPRAELPGRLEGVAVTIPSSEFLTAGISCMSCTLWHDVLQTE